MFLVCNSSVVTPITSGQNCSCSTTLIILALQTLSLLSFMKTYTPLHFKITTHCLAHTLDDVFFSNLLCTWYVKINIHYAIFEFEAELYLTTFEPARKSAYFHFHEVNFDALDVTFSSTNWNLRFAKFQSNSY